MYFNDHSSREQDDSQKASGRRLLGLADQDDAVVVLSLEQLHGVLLVQTVRETNIADLGKKVTWNISEHI